MNYLTDKIAPSGPQELAQFAREQSGHLDSVTANRVINYLMTAEADGGFDQQQRNLLLGGDNAQEIVLSLYESAAYGRFDAAQNKENFKSPPATHLHALNTALGGLTAPYSNAVMKLVENFSSPEGEAFAEKLWKQQGRSFDYATARLMVDLGDQSLDNPAVASFYEFQVQAFNEYVRANAAQIGLEANDVEDLKLELFSDRAELCGQYCQVEEQGPLKPGVARQHENVIQLNKNAASFAGNPAAVEGTLFHEYTHHMNKMLVKALIKGKLSADHPLHDTARVLLANQIAYLGPEVLGHQVYATQAEELGPMAIGNEVEAIVKERRADAAFYVATMDEVYSGKEVSADGLRGQFAIVVNLPQGAPLTVVVAQSQAANSNRPAAIDMQPHLALQL